MRWFFGYRNPYDVAPSAPKFWPEILTIKWWRWCLHHGWNGLAKERIRLYYIRRIQQQLRRPVCWLIGHNTFHDSSWSYDRIVCSRCRKTTKKLR